MFQAFYTAGSGIYAQQRNIDLIANNIANVNTPGYRIMRAEFQEILDGRVRNAGGVLTGFGAKIAGISVMPLPDSVNPLGMKVVGEGFFVVQDDAGAYSYTKNGDFTLKEEDGRYFLATKNGEYVLDREYERIEMTTVARDAVVAGGMIYPAGNQGEEGIAPAIVRFNNPAGLARGGAEQYVETDASGQPVLSDYDRAASNYFDELGALVMDNQIIEMTRIVETQRAYQLNSKTLQIVDEMVGMANHLRG